ncbi:MAG TPA: cardiolipin synthase [Thermoanaerobaculia bacterium]|nr:cardiolipin synthase [Thermoanaerobaculia bacterium]
MKNNDHLRITQEGGTTYIRLPVIAFSAIVLALIAMTILVWSATRKPSIALHVRNTGELQALIPSIVGLTQGTLDRGNRVELLENGDGFFPRVLRDVAAARSTIHVESYIWHDGAIGNTLANALAAKAKQGVEVRVLVDASGGSKMSGDTQSMLERAGAHVARFHPIRISNLGRLNNRDHRKIIVIDGRIGYTGGLGIADEWTGHAQDKKHWRDTALRVEGPVVSRLQSAFCENWIEETGEIPAGEKYFPPPQSAGETPAHVAYTSPTGNVSSVQVLYYLAIKAAQHEIIIQNPYLLPDDEAIDALEEAVKRGVDVKIMVPATGTTDSAIVQHASHHHFGTLLQRGVKLWEYEHTLLHQKIIVVDGVWACVGSTNFDDRSLLLNDEISIGVLDPAIASQLRSAFERDRKFARQRTFDEWRHRSMWHKLTDGLAYLGNSQL